MSLPSLLVVWQLSIDLQNLTNQGLFCNNLEIPLMKILFRWNCSSRSLAKPITNGGFVFVQAAPRYFSCKFDSLIDLFSNFVSNYWKLTFCSWEGEQQLDNLRT